MRQLECGTIQYGSRKLSYDIVLTNRKTMEIAVYPDQSIVVRAPEGIDKETVEERIRKRSRWIVRQIAYFEQFAPRTKNRCYVNGETHLYLGRQYRLRVARGEVGQVKLLRGELLVVSPDAATPELIKSLLLDWYSAKARVHLTDSIERCWQKFRGIDIDKPELTLRRMKTRWGSLSNKGTLTLNTDLIRAPKECIDYVVIHELCHLVHHNHGPDFYALLELISPDWEKHKQKLELSTS